MFSKWSKVGVFASALVLSGCSFGEEALWPSLTGEDPAGEEQQAAPAQTAASTNQTAEPLGLPPATSQPALGSTNFQPVDVTPGQTTGTAVGARVDDLRGQLTSLISKIRTHNEELQDLRVKTVQDSQSYHGTIAAINARLQVGTTPGNPILVQQFNSSLSDLDRLSNDIAMMNVLANKAAEDSNEVAYLLDATQATFGLSGALDEDHRQLAVLQDETNQTAVLIERLLKEVTNDVRRQTNYVAAERANLNALAAGIKAGEIYGVSLSNVGTAHTALGTTPNRPTYNQAPVAQNRRPLVVIRFDRTNVRYQQALYTTVSQVLERRPNASFDVVAVAPASAGAGKLALDSTKARRHAEEVLRSLQEMGLPPNRAGLNTATSQTAQTTEVHLYLR